MKHISKKILALMLLSAVLYSPRAAAISKLDFFAPAEGISTRVEKIAKKKLDLRSKKLRIWLAVYAVGVFAIVLAIRASMPTSFS